MSTRVSAPPQPNKNNSHASMQVGCEYTGAIRRLLRFLASSVACFYPCCSCLSALRLARFPAIGISTPLHNALSCAARIPYTK